jgi:hypothetical protein
MDNQLGRAPDNACFRLDMTVGSGSNMTSIDFDSHRNEAGQVDFPAGVEAGSGFGENHADTAMQQA